MRILLYMLPLVALLCSCASKREVRQQDLKPLTAAAPPPFAPSPVVMGDLRREHDATFSSQTQHLIAAARQYLETQDHQPVDAYYRVTHVSDHYEVYVQFVLGYHDSQPEFAGGLFCIVRVREDGSVIDVLPGA
jgi:hypothetical protein